MASPSDLQSALILGGVSWNTLLYLDALPAGAGALLPDLIHEAVGGSGAGQAMNLATLGVQASLWAPLGKDPHAEWVREGLDRFGVDLISQSVAGGTERHVNFMDPDGDRLSVFVNPGPDRVGVDPDSIVDRLQSADLVSVVIKDYCRPLLPLVADSSAAVWVDLHDWNGATPHHLEFIEAADCLQMSSLAHPAWRRFLESRIDAGAELCIATHGAAGASAITSGEGWIDIPAVPVDRVIDTNGAGDGFFAGFATTWHKTGDLREALEAGATQAALVVQSPELAPIP